MSDAKDTTNKNGTAEAVPAPALSADEQMIQDGFNALLNDYLSSNHRRKVERITKAFNFANQAHAAAPTPPTTTAPPQYRAMSAANPLAAA